MTMPRCVCLTSGAAATVTTEAAIGVGPGHQMRNVAVAIGVPRLDPHPDHPLDLGWIVRIANLLEQHGIFVHCLTPAPDLQPRTLCVIEQQQEHPVVLRE